MGESVNQVIVCVILQFTRNLVLVLKAVARGLKIKSKSETTLLLFFNY